jgi:hypothetical protein
LLIMSWPTCIRQLNNKFLLQSTMSQQSTANPFAAYQLQAGKQYTAEQVWQQKSRGMQVPGGDPNELLAAKQRERDALVFPFPKPGEGGALPASFTFTPMTDALGGISPHDQHFTPLGPQFPSQQPLFAQPPSQHADLTADKQVLRLLLSQTKQSLQETANHLSAIEALLNQ